MIQYLSRCEIPHRPTERRRCALYMHTRIYLVRGLLGAHWLRSCKNSEVKRVGGWSNPRMGDHPGKLFLRGLLGAHWLRSCKNSEVKRVGGWSNPRMGDHPGKLFRSWIENRVDDEFSESSESSTVAIYGFLYSPLLLVFGIVGVIAATKC
ncbi:hypothetical protein L3X38_002859 [Prunus dulcis]|uniref:Uncharacterized protein n=1 Tax=Prunus dulcis TaxID=3755 RepID=A0AAD4WUS2_PRUDU|nr:hypothetical protein L3X38_002859 [Prunus dulcis]